MLRNLHSRATDLSAASAEDCRQLTKARVIAREVVVHLREERDHKETKKSGRAEARKMKQTATACTEIEGLSATSNREKQHSIGMCAGKNLQKAGSDEEEDRVDAGRVSVGETEGEDDSLIPAGGLLDDMLAGNDGEVAEMVGTQVEIVTRSGRRAGCVDYS